MGKPQERYCVKAFQSHWRIWDRKLSRWWGNPFADFPTALLKELNTLKRPEKIAQFERKMIKPL